MKKTILFAALLVSQISWACRGGNQVSIDDVNGKQIGVIEKGEMTNFLPLVDKGFYIGQVDICNASKSKCNRMQLFGKARKQLVLNRATLDRKSVILFEMLDAQYKVIGHYEIAADSLFRVARSGGCGGSLNPVKN